MIPDNAIYIPNKETPYLAVWQTEDNKIVLALKKFYGNYQHIALDGKILPDLVDALIKIQNNEP